MQITWLSQGGFLFENNGKRIAVDPYLSNDLVKLGHDRMTPPPLSYEQLKPDCVIFTHDHLDHYDPITVAEIVRLYPDCVFAGSQNTLKHHKSLGYDCSNFALLNLGDVFEFGGLTFKGVFANHSDEFAIGLVISDGKKFVYLSGDTLADEKILPSVLNATEGNTVDLAIVCINGKLGNMPWTDAFMLVMKLMPRKTMPMHYGLFADNTEDPQPFFEHALSIGVEIETGEKPFVV